MMSGLINTFIIISFFAIVFIKPGESCVKSFKKEVKKPYDRPKFTKSGKCLERPESPVCDDVFPGKSTYFPNVLKKKTFEDASKEIHVFEPLIKVKCSPYIREFLCGLYFPECSRSGEEMVLPCKELCEEAHSGCVRLMEKFGFSWPKPMKCNLFPSKNSGNCYRGSLAAEAQPTNVTITRQGEGEAPSKPKDESPDCEEGAYTCRDASVKAFVNGKTKCCFEGKQLLYTTSCSANAISHSETCKCSISPPTTHLPCEDKK